MDQLDDWSAFAGSMYPNSQDELAIANLSAGHFFKHLANRLADIIGYASEVCESQGEYSLILAERAGGRQDS